MELATPKANCQQQFLLELNELKMSLLRPVHGTTVKKSPEGRQMDVFHLLFSLSHEAVRFSAISSLPIFLFGRTELVIN